MTLPIQAAKSELRARMQATRERLAADRSDAGPVVARIVLEQGLVGRDDIASVYWPMGAELDVRPLIEALWNAGRRVVLPATPPRGQPLTFRRFTPDTALKPAPFGTMEPPPTAPALAPTVLFVPLLAFDAAGRRLGYGAGYYDRTLQTLRADGSVRAYGVAFAGQEVERTPTDALDQPLDGVVTERGFRQFARN